ERLVEMGDGFKGAPLFVKGFTEVLFGNSIVGSESERVCPKRLAILPVSGLAARGYHRRSDETGREWPEQESPALPPRRQVRHPPGQQNAEPNLGNISVPICMRLIADLEDADHWDQHDEVPKPTRDQVSTTTQKNYRHGDGCQHHR